MSRNTLYTVGILCRVKLQVRVHLKEEKKNQEGKEMGIDYEMAVQTASYHSWAESQQPLPVCQFGYQRLQ